MPIQRKKKAPKRRNPCLPCNPSTRTTRFSRMKRNPEDYKKLEAVVKEVDKHATKSWIALHAALNILDKNAEGSERINNLANECQFIFDNLKDFSLKLGAILQHFHDERKYS